jgi:hypothetical protein
MVPVLKVASPFLKPLVQLHWELDLLALHRQSPGFKFLQLEK